VANECNFAMSVDQDYMRNPLDSIVLRSSGTSLMEMFNLLPSLCFDVLSYNFDGLVDADTTDSNLVTPFRGILLQHVLVVSHRGLARWAPCGPEIEQNDLSFFMLDTSLI